MAKAQRRSAKTSNVHRVWIANFKRLIAFISETTVHRTVISHISAVQIAESGEHVVY